MKKNKNLLYIISILLFFLFFVSCSKKEVKNTTNNNLLKEKDSVQFLNSCLETEPATLDPSKFTDSYAALLFKNIGESLTRLEENEDGSTEIKPAGAESWKVSDDKLVYTFYIRDAKWSDGTQITAKDYEFSIKRTCDPKNANPNGEMFARLFKNGMEVFSGILPIDKIGVEAIDDKTLKFTLNKPIAYFLDYTYAPQFVPQKEEYVQKFGDKYGSEANTIISSGPFILKSWSHGNEINLVKNENYWDKDNVFLEKISFKIIYDEGARHNSMSNGSIDHLDVTMSNWKKIFSKNPNITLIEYPRPHVGYGFFNTKDKLFKNKNIRKAFLASLDRKEICKAVWDDSCLPGLGWISPAISINGKNYRELAGSPIEKFIEENTDPKKLLLKGMEELGLGQDPSTITVNLSVGGTDKSFRILVEYLQQTWMEKLGVKVVPEFNEWSLFLSNIYSGNFQIGQMGNIESIDDPAGPMENHLSISNSVNNFWKSEEFDKLYWEAAVETDYKKRIEIYRKLEDMIICDEAVVNPICHQLSSICTYNYIKNLPVSPFSTSGFKYVYTSGRK